MKIELASSLGFCFGVQRAIDIAQTNTGSKTYGPLIHNKDEINRLKTDFNVGLVDNLKSINSDDTIVVRTHGIEKHELEELQNNGQTIIDATCPYVTTPQNIVSHMSKEGYSIVIFGDENHPEIKGVKSYSEVEDTFVVANEDDLNDLSLKNKVAVISQTTKKFKDYNKIISKLISSKREVRVFNTICNATSENQDAALELAQKSDVMIIIGGKQSSNTKQLFNICKENCNNSYLIENEKELQEEWFMGKELCGISAGASTPGWIISNVKNKIMDMTSE